MRFALVAALSVWTSSCCWGPEYLSFAVVRRAELPGGGTGIGSSAPAWGGSETVDTGDALHIGFGEDETLSKDVLELYDGERRAPLPFSDVFVPTDTEGCDHQERTYELEAVAPGTYTLVHRRANGTGDQLNCIDCPWTSFEGEEALVLELIVAAE